MVQTTVFINKDSFGGKIDSKIKKMAPEISNNKKYSPSELNAAFEEFLDKKNENNQSAIIVGGDGSIHHFINKVWSRNPKISLGIIGAGSSNSLLRSRISHLFSKNPNFKNLHFTNFSNTQFIDIGKMNFFTENETKPIYFASNSSIGFLAKGNDLFNKATGLLKLLKGFKTEWANTFVFFKLLLEFKPVHCRVIFNQHVIESRFLNIQILKAHYYSGNYHFENKNTLDSGFFELHLFHYHSKWQTLKTFFYLSINRIDKVKDHHSYLVNELNVESQDTFLVEADGELFLTQNIHYKCLKKSLKLAGPTYEFK